MFKCTECEKLFNIKPDYCDCGNDLFEETKNNAYDEIKQYKQKRNGLQ